MFKKNRKSSLPATQINKPGRKASDTLNYKKRLARHGSLPFKRVTDHDGLNERILKNETCSNYWETEGAVTEELVLGIVAVFIVTFYTFGYGQNQVVNGDKRKPAAFANIVHPAHTDGHVRHQNGQGIYQA